MGEPPSGYDGEVSATHPGAPDEPRRDQDFDRLLRENQELKDRANQLEGAFADLSRRLYRVEVSVIFRLLRWLGSKLLRLGVPVAGAVPRSAAQMAAAAGELYAVWAQESALLQKMAGGGRSAPAPGQSVTIYVDAHDAEPEKLARTLRSLAAQEHREWELFVCAGSQAPSLEPCIREHTAGHTAEIVGSLDTRRYSGELVVLLHPHAILDPSALREWLAAAAPDAVAVYSDWDHIDPSGHQYAPRFTPELSRELLAQTPYWGDCYLVRKAALQAAGPDQSSSLASRHGLALRLAETLQPIRRVPRMLWHLQDPPAAIASLTKNHSPDASKVRSARRASLIVCSRNPARLNRCLQGLQPFLSAGHEAIVVVHAPSGDSAGLEKIAAQWGARAVLYRGPFHFGEMNRVGVEASRNEVLCLLNDDVYPVAQDWLDRMLAQAVRSDVAVVGALLLYPDRTIQHAGIVVGKSWHPAHIGRARVDSPFWPWLGMTREVTAVTGACMATRRMIWDELGGFDFRFPVNYNDVDLCLRAGERGYRVILEARAILTHEEGQTRATTVLPEESELFHAIWRNAIAAPDRFFNPQLGQVHDAVQLRYPWTLVR